MKRQWIAAAIAFAALVIWIVVGLSQQGGPRKAESEANTAQRSDNNRSGLSHLLPPTASPVGPTINVYTAKHAHEESECAKPKDWKEWGLFGFCRSVEWLDAERIIAIFTVILGLATWKLWNSTDALVKGADETARKQLRANLRVIPFGMNSMTTQDVLGHVVFKNVGKMVATDVRWIVNGPTKGKKDFAPAKLQNADCVRSTVISIGGKFQRGTKAVSPLIRPNPDEYWFVWGRVVYRDGFEAGRFIDFCHSYPAARITADPSGSGYSIDAKHARQHDYGNDAN